MHTHTLRTDASTPSVFAQTSPVLAPGTAARLVAAGHSRFRVLDAHDRILGHLQVIPHSLGTRYRAQRYHSPAARFRDLGDFWSADEAVSCLRNG